MKPTQIEPKVTAGGYWRVKCLLDFVGATAGLILLCPVIALIAISVKLDSPGPVFFLQERLGKDGRVFKIVKFRTMVQNAVSMGSGIHTNEADPRITRVGQVLRKTSLDETPQLINVLKGEMSLVGPRPPLTFYPRKYEDYDPAQRNRFAVRPGITGYSQVKVRNHADWDQKIVYDIEYVHNMSLLTDLQIMISTVRAVMERKGIYVK